jgi:hypothetical protein
MQRALANRDTSRYFPQGLSGEKRFIDSIALRRCEMLQILGMASL